MAASPITYEPAVYTVTGPMGQFELSKVITLQPQTTPFRPARSVEGSCLQFPRDIRCAAGSQGDVVFGSSCYGDQHILGTDMSLPAQCYPESYRDILTPFGLDSEVRNLAYPGTACISFWTPACTTTFTIDGRPEQYVQTWCCPPGGWSCFSTEGVQYRNCVSLLSTPTSVWMVASTTDTGGALTTLWSSFTMTSLSYLPTSGPIIIQFPPFPLYGGSPTSRGANTSSTIQPVDSNPGISQGAVAGIIVGAVVAALVFGASVFIFWRKRKQRKAEQVSTGNAAESEHHDGLKPGYDGKPELSSRGAEVSEMSASTKPAELPSRVQPTEVAADRRPVELE